MPVNLSRVRGHLPLAVIVALSYATRLHYRASWLGEQDLARLIVEAATWQETGAFPPGTYTSRTSPLYLMLIYGLRAAGVGFDGIAGALGHLNVLAASLVAVPLYLLWRRLSSPAAALCGVILLQIVPALWVGSLYGMPHVPALLFAATALATYARALDAPERGLSLRHAGVAALCVMIACSLKADILLTMGSFLAVAFCLRRLDRRALLAALAIPAAGLAATLLLTRLALPPAVTQAMDAGEWSRRFPVRAGLLIGDENMGILADSAGPYLLVAAAAGAVWLLVQGKLRRELLLVLAWSAPAIVFWGVRDGNSARHLMASVVFLVWVAGAALVALFESREVRILAVACLLQFNYVSRQAGGSTVQPSSRLLESAREVNSRAGKVQEAARRAAADPAPRKVYIGTSELPYYIHESQRIARSFQYRRDPRDPYGGEELVIERVEGTTQTIHTLDPDDYRRKSSKYKDWSVWRNGQRTQAGAAGAEEPPVSE